jgi:mannosyl-oligosaccharide alpha-1,2-mannosidase
MYVLYKTTGDPKWRERGWKIFELIEKYATTEYGYASVDKVDMVPPRLIDDIPR